MTYISYSKKSWFAPSSTTVQEKRSIFPVYILRSRPFVPFLMMTIVQGIALGILPFLYIQIAFSIDITGQPHTTRDFLNVLKRPEITKNLIFTAIATLITIVTFVLDLTWHEQSLLSTWGGLMSDALKETIYDPIVPSHENFFRIYTMGASRLRDLFFGLSSFLKYLAGSIVSLGFIFSISYQFTLLFLSILIISNTGLAYLHAKVVEEFSVVKHERESFVVHDLKQKARLMKLVRTAGKSQSELEQDLSKVMGYFEKEQNMLSRKPVWMNLLFALNTHVFQSILMALGVLYLQFHGDITPKEGVILFLYVSNLGNAFQQGENALSNSSLGSIGFGLFVTSKKACQVLIDDVLGELQVASMTQKSLSALVIRSRSSHSLPGPNTMVSLTSVSKSFNGHMILRNININLQNGLRTAIVGVSGAGKSTLLDLITGYQLPDVPNASNHLLTDAAYVPPLNYAELWKTTLHHNLCYSAKVEPSLERVMQVLRLLKLGKERPAVPMLVLDHAEYSISDPDRDVLFAPLDPSTLSSGERQRVLLGRALLSGRQTLVSDEGTAALDKQIEEQVLEVMKTTFPRGWILVTHDWAVLKACDRAFVLNQGIIEESGHPMDMVQNKESIVHLRRLFVISR